MSEHKPVCADPSASREIAFRPAELRPRHDGWTAEKQIRFIEALAATLCVDEACRRVGMSDTSAYELRNRPCGGDFRRAWDAAIDCNMTRVEHGAVSRSVNGVMRPIFYKGEQVGEYRHFDERLTMFLLRNRRPDRYGKWIERMPAPPPLDPDLRPGEQESPDPAIRLDAHLTGIEYCAPVEHGNPVFWEDTESDQSAAHARERVGQQT